MVEIPTGLVEAQIRYNGDAGREFIAVVPARAAEFLERWGLTRTGPGMHGVTALVLPVERADGTPAALKLQALDEESAGEHLALRAWGGDGSVRLLDHDASTGTMPADVPDALGGLDERGRGVLCGCAAAVAEVVGEPGDRLLHWDLHDDNVLAGGREPWLAIDPKPLAGDPGFDLMPAIGDHFTADDVWWRFDLMTEVMGLDRDRARAWTSGRALQNCLWDVEDGEPLQEEQLVTAELLLAGRRAG
ncbi:aminoglycoside phosphotransferase family protein [Streptomyces sp. NPDC059999]|uniref:aminoglycoside phosphotransferase family protein n=1 Tax=Streptomyces sp. NPDC059999 TaxID=3347030 RepID=UPI00367F8E65